jgi:hypothetical protein
MSMFHGHPEQQWILLQQQMEASRLAAERIRLIQVVQGERRRVLLLRVRGGLGRYLVRMGERLQREAAVAPAAEWETARQDG